MVVAGLSPPGHKGLGGKADVTGLSRCSLLVCNQTRHRSNEVRAPARYAQHVSRRLAAGRWHPMSRSNQSMRRRLGDNLPTQWMVSQLLEHLMKVAMPVG